MMDLDQYVGLPWKLGGRDRRGLDCFGLVRLVLAEQAGILLPDWLDDPDALARSVNDRCRAFERHRPDMDFFLPVPPFRQQVLDIAAFFRGGVMWHMGILVEYPDIILHIEDTTGSQRESLSRRPDLRAQLGGFYRARCR